MAIPEKILPDYPPKFTLDQKVSFPANFINDFKFSEEDVATGEIMMIDARAGRKVHWVYGISVEGYDNLFMISEWVLQA
jgi:hypothetical protein